MGNLIALIVKHHFNKFWKLAINNGQPLYGTGLWFESTTGAHAGTVPVVVNQIDMIITEKPFPNGFDSWQETHYEVVAEITRIALADEGFGLVNETATTQGTGGLYELAKQLTDEFETLHAGRDWDGEFFDEIWEFLATKNL
jgi:hypothetical protein